MATSVKVLNNTTEKLLDDLKDTIRKGSRVSIAAACFSIYAYQALQKELEGVEEFRFLYTAPSFVDDSAEGLGDREKQRKEFYIPKFSGESGLYGTEFEVKLRNELTQRGIARECAAWIRKKAKFKANAGDGRFNGSMTIESSLSTTVYPSLQEFTTVDLGAERGNRLVENIVRMEEEAGQETEVTKSLVRNFESLWNDRGRMQDVTEAVIQRISSVYEENAPEFIYFMTLYHVFHEFLDDISEDVLPNEATGFKQSKIWSLLYDFQRDAVLAIINKLETYNGCILADSVGLGKTFTALAVVKYYESRNKSVLVLCPKKLAENWNTYKDNYVNNPIATDRLNYDVLFHTDLSRSSGQSNGLDLDRLNWGNYDLLVIDESHNFRNGIGTHSNTQDNRYQKLMEKVIRAGVKTKVLMLSATPVNNNFSDLKNQLALAYEGNAGQLDQKLKTKKSIDDIFRQAQKAFNSWSKEEPEERSTEKLLSALDFDFFELLDSVTIARSRRHIEKYYDTAKIGTFPTRLKPVSVCPGLTDLNLDISYRKIAEQLMKLTLSIYMPSKYILPSKLGKYRDLTHNKGENLTQSGREQGICRLMSINLLKRLESSVHAFCLTLTRIKDTLDTTIEKIDRYDSTRRDDSVADSVNGIDFDLDDENNDLFQVGKEIHISLADMDWVSWRAELKKDQEILNELIQLITAVTPAHDSKLQELFHLLSEKIKHPINEGNKKVLIFSAFSDTAEYLYEQVSAFLKARYGLDTAIITGSVDGKSTVKQFPATLNNVLTCFSPVSKGRELLMPDSKVNIDILIATDCISEGQNLQDCDYLINYDIHWNPVRIIQRFGRVDRIGSRNACIQLVNFWPDVSLDEYINLKARVESRMKATILTATGDDDLINAEEKGDLAYRKAQLRRMQEEVVDIEESSNGISIMDLGLNEYRLDLMEYMKHDGAIETKPRGLHALVPATEELPAGVIFVLKNIQDSVNIDGRNQIHPFYLVYLRTDGSVVCDYLHPKQLLGNLRLLCKGRKEPLQELCARFNRETQDGRDMKAVSKLLGQAIDSILQVKEESDIDSLFTPGGTTALKSQVSGLGDFELICFLVVK